MMTRRLIPSFLFEWPVMEVAIVRGEIIIMANIHGELPMGGHRGTHQVSVALSDPS